MRLFSVSNWLKSPADRDVIHRWTVGGKPNDERPAMGYALDLPQPDEPDRWEFLAIGDTGDADAAGPALSPQDAVAQQLARDAALPDSDGAATLVVHTGDVIYMTGERRLYDRNFRRPYTPFLTPESTVDNLVFRLPFLPVPGNHDYYDLGGWALWLSRVPILGAGLRAITHQLFAFSVPEGGSQMGRAYMNAFVDPEADTTAGALPYRPGTQTRLPNRYYRYRVGDVDFFALDSNTLDAPPPEVDAAQMREDAARDIQTLEARAADLDRQLRREQRALDHWRAEQQEQAALDPDRRAALLEKVTPVTGILARLHTTLRTFHGASPAADHAMDAVELVERRWIEGAEDLVQADDPDRAAHALRVLDEASDEGCAALRAVEGLLSTLPEGNERAQVLGARNEMDQALERWSDLATPEPGQLTARLHQLSEEALDVQRELTLERRRLHYRPDDYDAAQIGWLDDALAEAIRERPDGWRVVYLHHPLYTTIGNHVERPDVTNVRDNLLALLQNRAHLVLSGHSHAFEWFRSSALPHAGFFVTGGGGQISLRPSVLEPRRFRRNRDRYDALRGAGVEEYAMGGYGPAAPDGEAGLLYHYLRIEVTPDALIVRPVGVRRLETGGYRREEPMPVFHVADLPPDRPAWKTRRLESVAIRRDAPPQANWV